MNYTENLWKIFNVVNDWIKFSDTKAIALLGIQGVVLAFILSKLIGDESIYPIKTIDAILIFGGILFNSLSFLYAFLCLNPKLKLEGDPSTIFFGSISKHFNNSNQYEQHFDNSFSNEEQVKHELTNQIYVNSCIAQRKFEQVSYSLRLFIISLVFWMLLILSNLLF